MVYLRYLVVFSELPNVCFVGDGRSHQLKWNGTPKSIANLEWLAMIRIYPRSTKLTSQQTRRAGPHASVVPVSSG